MALTNSQVVPEILRGRDAENGRGSFWGSGSPSRWTRVARGWIQHTPVARSLDIVAEKHGGIEAIVLSYATPLAVKIAGVWFRPDISHSPTTSSKHAPHLPASCRWLPWDASVEDVENVLAGYTVYDPWRKTFRRGAVARPENVRALAAEAVAA